MKIAFISAPKALPSTHKCMGHCNAPTTCDWITVPWRPKLKLFWHTAGPKSAQLSAPFFLLMWYPHRCVLKGAESPAGLGAVGCENSFHSGSKSTPIHSQVPGALQCPNHLRRDRSALAAKAEALLAHHRPQKWLTIRPLFSCHVIPTLLCFESGGEWSSFGGCRGVKIASILPPKALPSTH